MMILPFKNSRPVIPASVFIAESVDVIGGGSIIAAGTVITPGTAVPLRSLVAGVPGKLRRPVTDDEYAEIVERAAHYIEFAQIYRSQGVGLSP